jgi:hypothetical protein
VRARLMAMHNKRKIDTTNDPTKPTLRRAPGSSGGTVDDSGNGTSTATDDEDRPTLKRRPASE